MFTLLKKEWDILWIHTVNYSLYWYASSSKKSLTMGKYELLRGKIDISYGLNNPLNAVRNLQKISRQK